MTSKILTKTDRQMEDRMIAVANDPFAPTRSPKARAFKRTWLELAEALGRRAGAAGVGGVGLPRLRPRTVARSCTCDRRRWRSCRSYRFLETSAPARDRTRTSDDHFESPDPELAAVEFVQSDRARAPRMQRRWIRSPRPRSMKASMPAARAQVQRTSRFRRPSATSARSCARLGGHGAAVSASSR